MYPISRITYGSITIHAKSNGKMKTSYFNTTEEPKERVKEYKAKAQTQEQKILSIFGYYNEPLTAEHVHRHFDSSTPLTSIRRAITVLATGREVTDPDNMNEIIYEPGKLEKAGKVKGQYGRNIHTWKLTK